MRSSSRLDGGDIHLDVPPVGDVPEVSPQRAFARCRTAGGECDTSSSATMKLALVTTTAAGTAGAGGSINPLIDHALTYVIEWTGLPCVPAGGVPRPPGSPQPAVTAGVCRLVDFVSARSGKSLYGFQSSY